MAEGPLSEAARARQSSAGSLRDSSCAVVSAAGCLSLAVEPGRKLRRTSLRKSRLLQSSLETPGQFRLPFGVQAYTLWENFDPAAETYTPDQLRIVWEIADFLQDHDTAQQCVALLAAALHALQLGGTPSGAAAAALVDTHINTLLLHSMLLHTPDLTGVLLHELPSASHERVLDCATHRGALDMSGTLFAAPVLQHCCRTVLPALAPRLHRLHLSGCSVTGGNLESVVGAFAELARLTHLDLSCNRIAVADAATLGAALPALRSLQALDVFGAEMHEEGASLVLAGAAQLQHLVALDMGCNAICGGGLRCFEHLPHMSALRTLAIGCNPTAPEVASRLGAHTSHAASSGHAARGLLASDLRRHNRLGVAGAAACSLQLRESVSLRHLDVSGCGCGPRGGAALSCALAALIALTRLDAAHNALLDDSAARVAGALQACVGLKWLDLSWNSISGPRCVLALKGLPTLQHLDLRVNDLHDVCVLAMAGTFRRATSGHGCSTPSLGRDLEYLDVSYNDVRHGSMGTLLVQAAALPAIAVLRVAGNMLGDSDASRLAECEGPLARVRELDVAWCRLGANAKAALRGAAERASGGRCRIVTEECGPHGPDALVLRGRQHDAQQ